MKLFFKRFLDFILTKYVDYFMIAFTVVLFNLLIVLSVLTQLGINFDLTTLDFLQVLSLTSLLACVMCLPVFFRNVVGSDNK